MIKVCKTCSNISLEKLEEILSKDQISEECIDICQKFDHKCFGYINNQLYYTKTEEEFISIIKAQLNK